MKVKKWKVSEGISDVPLKEKIYNVFKKRGVLEKVKLHSPLLMDGMDDSIVVFNKNKDKKILVFGDYDADGVTSTTILFRYLKEVLNINVDYLIPDRLKDGYGMKLHHVQEIVKNGYDLVITVDTGIASVDEVDYLVEHGIDVIITDHHEQQDEIPRANAVVNPMKRSCEYPFKGLSGASVALKFVEALSIEYKKEDQWKRYIDLAAIGTIADVMPLTDENKVIVVNGINKLKYSTSIGVRVLMSRIFGNKTPTSTDIAFQLAPIINASSRLGEVDIVVDLLLTDDENEANVLADSLIELNERRKVLSKDMEESAKAKVVQEYNFKSNAPIILYDDCSRWHKGIIGITAAKIAETFERPTIIFSKEGDKLTGSSRSYADNDMMDMLYTVKDHIVGYGGHKGAAGLTVDFSEYKEFKEKLQRYECSGAEEVLEIDQEISLDEVDINSIEFIDNFEPFGEANREIVFCSKDVEVVNITKIGKKDGAINAHLKMSLRTKDLRSIDAIGFFNSYYADAISRGDKIDVAFKLAVNEFRGNKNPQLIIEDINFSRANADILLMEKAKAFKEGRAEYDSTPILANDLNRLVKLIDGNKEGWFINLTYISSLLGDVDVYKADIILSILDDTDFIDYEVLSKTFVYISPFRKNTSRKVSDSELYKKTIKKD